MAALVALILLAIAVAAVLDVQFAKWQARRAERLLADGGAALEAGDLDRAVHLLRKAASRAFWIRGGPLFFLTHYNLANVLARRGEHAGAEKAARRALRSICSLPDSEQLGFHGSYPEVRHCLALFSESLLRQGKHAEAIAYLETVIKLWQEADGPDSLHAGYYSQELGLACMQLGLADQGIDHLAQAVSVSRLHFGEDHPAFATALHHYGAALTDTGRAYEAGKSLEQSLAIRTALFGATDPSVAETLAALGSLRLHNCEYDEAAECFGKALGIVEHVFGSNHPEPASLRGKLAETRRRQGRLEESAQLANMALFVLGESKDPSYSEALETMACVRADQGGLSEAAQLLEQSRQWMSRSPGGLSRRARLLHNEARLRRRMGEEAKADELASLALAIRESLRAAASVDEATRIVPPTD